MSAGYGTLFTLEVGFAPSGHRWTSVRLQEDVQLFPDSGWLAGHFVAAVHSDIKLRGFRRDQLMPSISMRKTPFLARSFPFSFTPFSRLQSLLRCRHCPCVNAQLAVPNNLFDLALLL